MNLNHNKNYLFIIISLLTFILFKCDDVNNNSTSSTSQTPGYNFSTKSRGKLETTLKTKPNQNVYLGFSCPNDTSLIISPIQIIFSAENWDIPQYIEIYKEQASNDKISLAINHYSEDINYGSLQDETYDILAQNYNPSEDGEIITDYNFKIISPSTGEELSFLTIVDQENDVEYEEAGGGIASFQIILTARPESNVYLECKPQLDLVAIDNVSGGYEMKFYILSVDEENIVFTPNNWNVPKTITVTELLHVDKYEHDNDESYVTISLLGKSDSHFTHLTDLEFNVYIDWVPAD